MVKFDDKFEEEYYSNRMFKGEIARYNMLELCKHFIKNKIMNEDDFFKIQKEALRKYKEDANVGVGE